MQDVEFERFSIAVVGKVADSKAVERIRGVAELVDGDLVYVLPDSAAVNRVTAKLTASLDERVFEKVVPLLAADGTEPLETQLDVVNAAGMDKVAVDFYAVDPFTTIPVLMKAGFDKVLTFQTVHVFSKSEGAPASEVLGGMSAMLKGIMRGMQR